MSSRSPGAKASPDRAHIGDAIEAAIARGGPMPLDEFMARANAHYYATHDPFGAEGDFVTAPEVSQMFGELIGLALTDLWQRAGAPADAAFVELGPGRGTLAADALRAMEKAGFAPQVHLVETSARLRAAQAERVPGAIFHETIATLPDDRPLLIVANEFFDALPIRQYIRTVAGWRARLVAEQAGELVLLPGREPADAAVPAHLWNADPGGVVEACPAATAIAAALAARLVAQGGACLSIDYGHDGHRHGDTLQAVRAHAYADPLAKPGASDLTAHVDFGALAAAAEAAGATTLGPIPQGQWLIALGLSDRAAALARTAPARADEIAAAYRRLTDAEEMGALFKVLTIAAPEWPAVAGFR